MFSSENLISNKRRSDFKALREEMKRLGVTKILLWQKNMRDVSRFGSNLCSLPILSAFSA